MIRAEYWPLFASHQQYCHELQRRDSGDLQLMILPCWLFFDATYEFMILKLDTSALGLFYYVQISSIIGFLPVLIRYVTLFVGARLLELAKTHTIWHAHPQATDVSRRTDGQK